MLRSRANESLYCLDSVLPVLNFHADLVSAVMPFLLSNLIRHQKFYYVYIWHKICGSLLIHFKLENKSYYAHSGSFVWRCGSWAITSCSVKMPRMQVGFPFSILHLCDGGHSWASQAKKEVNTYIWRILLLLGLAHIPTFLQLWLMHGTVFSTQTSPVEHSMVSQPKKVRNFALKFWWLAILGDRKTQKQGFTWRIFAMHYELSFTISKRTLKFGGFAQKSISQRRKSPKLI
jgi:hypothetical protein